MDRLNLNLKLLVLMLYALIIQNAAKSQIYSVGNDDGFSFSCAGSPGNEIFLPILPLSFKTQCMPSGIRILWSLTETITPTIITPEKSIDGKFFQPCIGKINQQKTDFDFIDLSPGSKTTYYRLKIESQNEHHKYSHTIAAICSNNNIIISPNPSSGVFHITGGQPNTKIVITDVAGNRVFEMLNNDQNGKINVSHLKNGLYNLETYSGETRIQKRIIITK